MNKPAPKEPSMDEILSSIRQIIADDDAATVPRRQPFQPMVAVANTELEDSSPLASISFDAPAEEAEPLALSTMQIVEETEDEPEVLSFASITEGDDDAPEAGPMLVDPEDVSFEVEVEPETGFAAMIAPEADVQAETEAMLADVAAEAATAEPEPEAFVAPVADSFVPPRMSVADTAPMPDPTLSSDLAEKLLEPATDAAVRQTFARISPMPVGNESLTIEALMRDMLRPMLKEWLDENLPTVVERMVEKEIARVSRGLE